MTTTTLTVADSTELEKQIAYAKELKAKGFDYGIAVLGSQFVESMRAVHYKNSATALNELIDNAIEAGASTVHVALGFGKSDTKPEAIAVIDNGHGMVDDMVRLSVLWGGTHRGEEKQRKGWGRFGFGLPSASVNQCRRFSVYSRVEGDAWKTVTIDLDDIASGKYNEAGKLRIQAPEAKVAKLPEWVQKYLKASFPGGEPTHGTIVMWEKLDRITWVTRAGLRENVIPFLGVSYFNYLSQIDLRFDGTIVEPIDPLFITPGYRLFDEDEDRAEALPPAIVEVKSKLTGQKAQIRIRYSRMPLSFYAIEKDKGAGRGNANVRWRVKNMTRGIIVSRMGRMIDVLESTPWKGLEKFRNDDRYWGVEIDFPADLDEDFAIANNKQGVVLSERVWDLLDQMGVSRNISELRKWIGREQRTHEVAQQESGDEKRPSEKTLEAVRKFSRQRAGSDPVERTRRAREAFEQHVKSESRASSQPEEKVRQKLEIESVEHPYKVLNEDIPGGPFFRIEEVGGQKRLLINRAHRFYTEVYAAPTSTRKVRNALEVMLFVIGECELDAYANPDRKQFYLAERTAWSERLEHALTELDKYLGSDAESVDVDVEAA